MFDFERVPYHNRWSLVILTNQNKVKLTIYTFESWYVKIPWVPVIFVIIVINHQKMTSFLVLKVLTQNVSYFTDIRYVK